MRIVTTIIKCFSRPRPMATYVDRRRSRPAPSVPRLSDATVNHLVTCLGGAAFIFVLIWALDAVEKIGQL